MIHSTHVTYRIHTEDKPYLPEQVAKFFDSFAIFKGIGYWKGVEESTATIEIIGVEADRNRVIALADWLGTIGYQQSVYVTSTDVALDDIRQEPVYRKVA